MSRFREYENRNNNKGFLEEERRLCYVAISRAMEKLYITFANGRFLHGSFSHLMPSRFINEIPDDLLEHVKSNFQPVYGYKKTKYNKEEDYSQEEHIENYSQEENTRYNKYSFKIGQKVRHMKFGDGVIVSYTGKEENLKLHINFESYGRKWLVLSYAHLDFL